MYPMRLEPIYQYRLWSWRRLVPVMPQVRDGTVANVVFSTGIDRRDDLGSPDRFDVYYGMADKRIGVARLDLPEFLPPGGIADAPEGKV